MGCELWTTYSFECSKISAYPCHGLDIKTTKVQPALYNILQHYLVSHVSHPTFVASAWFTHWITLISWANRLNILKETSVCLKMREPFKVVRWLPFIQKYTVKPLNFGESTSLEVEDKLNKPNFQSFGGSSRINHLILDKSLTTWDDRVHIKVTASHCATATPCLDIHTSSVEEGLTALQQGPAVGSQNLHL